MRAIIQRVDTASVVVNDKEVGSCNKGILVLLGVNKTDTQKDLDYMLEKIIGLRIFEDENEKMNLSLQDIQGEMLVVSQFTLYGDCRKGKRPSFDKAAEPRIAKDFYESFVSGARNKGIKVATGEFQAHMLVNLVNNGPVTVIVDSEKIF